jgi:hypothetical protein
MRWWEKEGRKERKEKCPPMRAALKLTRRSCVDEGAVREVKPRKSAGLSRRERRGSKSEQGGSRREQRESKKTK